MRCPRRSAFSRPQCSADDGKELLAIAAEHDDLIARLKALRAREDAAVAKISFAGATLREVQQVRRELKEIRTRRAA